MTNLTAYERETHINYNYEEPHAIVFTYDRKLQNKLNKLVGVNPDLEVTKRGDDWMEYQVPKNWIKVSPPRQVNYTDEQRAAMAERLAEARNKKDG